MVSCKQIQQIIICRVWGSQVAYLFWKQEVVGSNPTTLIGVSPPKVRGLNWSLLVS
jgi:hypothetical protein